MPTAAGMPSCFSSTPKWGMPVAISEVLQKWMLGNPVRVWQTLPVIKYGSMIGLFVWWDRTQR